MQFLITLCLSAATAASIGAPFEPRRSDPVLVRSVIDGDTIDVALYGRVRLLGIDAPEIGRGFDTAAPFGREARERLTRLVLHRWVRLEQDTPALDVYNRHLAYVLTETGEFINATLVREGLARVSARVPLSRLGELKGAEAEAQAFRRGMWGAMPSTATAEYTRRSNSGRKVVRIRKPAPEKTKKKSGRRKTASRL